jgi:hypothetical protein
VSSRIKGGVTLDSKQFKKFKKRFLIGGLVASALCLFLVGCLTTTKKPTATVPAVAAPASVNSDVQALQSTMADVQSQLADQSNQLAEIGTTLSELETPDTSGFATQEDLANLQANLSAQIDALANPPEPEPEEDSELTETRWTPSVALVSPTYTTGNSDKLFLEIEADTRIKEEDIYYLTITLANTSPDEDFTNFKTGFKVILSPSDDSLVDEDDTYLDSDNSPWLSWESDYLTRTREGQEVTKRIEFESDKYTIGTLAAGDGIVLELVLELYYAD